VFAALGKIVRKLHENVSQNFFLHISRSEKKMPIFTNFGEKENLEKNFLTIFPSVHNV
jgi:hypothetical protein